MRSFRINLLNYRCFAGPKITAWSFFGESLTSFVGPNNAGKSTFLRILYEFRLLLRNLTDDRQLEHFVHDNNWSHQLLGVDDIAEVQSYGAVGPTLVEFLWDVQTPNEVSGVKFTINPEARAWNMELLSGSMHDVVTGLTGC